MVKHFSLKMSDEEYEDMKKSADERGISMKDVLYDKIKQGTFANGARLEEHSEALKAKKGLGTLHSDVQRTLKSSRKWIGGFDYERATRDLVTMYDWEDLSDADKELFLGYLKYYDIDYERDMDDVQKELAMIADKFGIHVDEVKGYYRRIRIEKHADEGTFESSLESD